MEFRPVIWIQTKAEGKGGVPAHLNPKPLDARLCRVAVQEGPIGGPACTTGGSGACLHHDAKVSAAAAAEVQVHEVADLGDSLALTSTH